MLFAMRRKLGAEADGYFEQAARCLVTESSQDAELEGKIKDIWNRIADLKSRLDVYYATTFFGKLVRWYDGRKISWLGSQGISVRIEEYVSQLSARHKSFLAVVIEKEPASVKVEEAVSQKNEQPAEEKNEIEFKSIHSDKEAIEEVPQEPVSIEEVKPKEETKAENPPEKEEHPVVKFFGNLFKKKEPKK